ncbi:MAG: DUF4340 domain-containing protein [Candidatus Thiodiazotropha sp. (ex Monitilora ramsayi)]|nr:DUF4340 domain-containing protein [Candidatus Thiodiazotropha sp. (ex Monitilora ramsayi)]
MLDRRAGINLLLLSVVCLLGLQVWQIQQADKRTALTQLDPDGIIRIEIDDLSGRQILLEREGSVWRIGDKRADANRIAQLLGLCKTPSLENFDLPADLRPFGLEAPVFELKLNSETLAFGNTDPINGWRYVRFAGQVHLIADGFYHHLSAPPEVWEESR